MINATEPNLPSIAILAGGLAQRLRPITETIPKALVDVGGRPFISYQLDRLRREGVREAVLCVGHLGEEVEAFVGDGSRFGLTVKYSYDGDQLLGTGGALRRALPLLGDTFFVTYGDTYLDISYVEVYEVFLQKSNALGLMTLLKNQNRWGKSNTLFKNGFLIAHSKKNPTPEMQHIDFGLSVIRRGPFEDWCTRKNQMRFDLNDYFASLSESGKLAGFEAKNRFHEIGTPEALAETISYLKTQKEEIQA